MALLVLILYTPTSTVPAPATSQPRNLRDLPCVVVNRSKVMPRRCQVSRACSGSSGTTMANRFQPNRIFRSRTHRRTAGSAPAPARLGARRPTGRDQLDPHSESPLARSTSYASLDRSFARIVCAYIYIYTRSSVRTYAYTCICACTCIRVSLRLFTCITQTQFLACVSSRGVN